MKISLVYPEDMKFDEEYLDTIISEILKHTKCFGIEIHDRMFTFPNSVHQLSNGTTVDEH